MKQLTLIPALAIFLLPSSAGAYLDPGTGNLLLQGLIAALATLSVSISLGWKYIKHAVTEFFRRISGKSPSPGQKDKQE